MKPLKLEFEGINSFSEHTVIDFEHLIKSGIFGIFGDTGSGKSTILDCINFALYGRVERSKEKTDIINYRCNAATVKFTFDLFNRGKRRTYYIERTLKRKNGVHSASLYEDGVCIAQQTQEVEKQIVEIIGVRAEDFRKCIALPQGEFSRFVKSLPSERLALIERLFSLSKYGIELKDKIADKIKDIDAEFANLSGRLEGYGDVSAESIRVLEQSIEDSNTALKSVLNDLEKAVSTFENLKTLYKKREEAKKIKSKIEQLTARKPSIDEMRQEISALPLCKEAVSFMRAADENNKQLQNIAAQLKDLNEKSAENEKTLARLEKELLDGEFESKTEELTKLVAKYQSFSGKPKRLAELDDELKAKREQYKEAVKLAEELKKEISVYAEETLALEKKVGKSRSEELEEFVNVEFKGAVLRTEYVASLEYFLDLNARLDRYDDGSELYGFIKKELKDRINLYKQRISDVRELKLENVTKQFEALQAAIKEREKDNELLRAAINKSSEAQRRADNNLSHIQTLKNEGESIRKNADEIKAELSAVFGSECLDYVAAENNATAQLAQLKARHKELLNQIEGCKTLRAKFGELQGKLNESTRLTEEKRRENLSKCADIVAKTGFKDINDCLVLAKKFADVQDAGQEVNAFDLEYASSKARYAELIAEGGLEQATEEALNCAENNKNAIERQKNELLQSVAVLESNLMTAKEKLKEKTALLKQFAEVQNNRNLIYQLRDLTKSNKFLEFIANEYLYDISSMASVTLLKLTDGRYYLTYKDNNFVVGDNFDCGNLRGVNTLSGGETFLVSLSLALALSQTICARSLKSIEFFFLDEGFGTLDSALLDTVMNALEKLKSSSFTIGVISHVEELKHRIDNKIIVQKATESHGSTVQTSC